MVGWLVDQENGVEISRNIFLNVLLFNSVFISPILNANKHSHFGDVINESPSFLLFACLTSVDLELYRIFNFQRFNYIYSSS